MSRLFITVDYFSHQWDPLDLGCASLELNRQIAELGRKLVRVEDELDSQHDAMQKWGHGSSVSSRHYVSSLTKEKHRLLSDDYRLCRLENIAWRQYRAGCQPDALKIDPITINWQKDSDVIWLYGPLFRRDDYDDDFERRAANIRHPQNRQQQQGPSVKSVLRKNTETKEAYVKHTLGKVVSRTLKRHSFPACLREVELADMAAAAAVATPPGSDEDYDNDDALMVMTTKAKELRFNPDVLEYIYHAELPLRQEKKRRYKKPASASSSAACRRAKALLLASRMPPSPPLSPSPPEEEIILDQHLEVEQQPSKDGWGWGWPFAASSPPSVPHQEPTIPSLCANLISLSAEVLTLMGTAAVYRGVGYGLGCPSTQQYLQPSSSAVTSSS